MSTLVLLVVLLLVLVVLLVGAGIAYLVHRHPPLGVPVTAAAAVLTVLVAVVALIATR
ncbi:hypothetical protein [Streptomyces inusitatus]|nr:hypothetical protein [Streptomyces inusitatus]